MNSRNTLSIRLGHDSNIAFRLGDFYHVVEFERVFGVRYFDWRQREKSIDEETLVKFVKEHYAISKFEFAINSDGISEGGHIAKAFGVIEAPMPILHHKAHAASALYQSPFDRCLIVSYDGGGGDGYIRAFIGDKKLGVRYVDSNRNIPQFSLGLGYRSFGHAISEISKVGLFPDKRGYGMSFAGKLMGLAAYGRAREDLIPQFVEYFRSLHMRLDASQRLFLLRKLGERVGLELTQDGLGGILSCDIAATVQAAFERVMFNVILPLIGDYRLPVVLTGGCALNVIFNQKLSEATEQNVWIPPNPSDCGLSLGGLFLIDPPVATVNCMYVGIPLVDRSELSSIGISEGGRRVSIGEVARLLAEGNVIGIARGLSEHGPRALGNRSLLCDPSVPNMKDRLNQKIKFREDFRPYAPVVRKEDASNYFECQGHDMAYMSFNPLVRAEWRTTLVSVTHVDNTSRVQTITREDNEFLYDLIGEFERIRGFGVLLNTSFNIRGRPILSSIKEALECLNSTDLDFCLIEDILFKKRI